jgi:hypothetical protein
MPSPQPGEPSEVTIDASPMRTTLLVAGSLAFALLGLGNLLGYAHPVAPWSFKWLIFWAGTIFFCLCAAIILWQGMMPGPLVSIGVRGLRDVRVSAEWIPWAAIVSISEANHAVVLKVDPAFAHAMPLTRHARWTSRLNAPLGFRSLYMYGLNLKGGVHALRRAVEDGLARFDGR